MQLVVSHTAAVPGSQSRLYIRATRAAGAFHATSEAHRQPVQPEVIRELRQLPHLPDAEVRSLADLERADLVLQPERGGGVACDAGEGLVAIYS